MKVPDAVVRARHRVAAQASAANTLRRTGMLEPRLAVALVRSLRAFGPGVAAGFRAGALRRPDRVALVDADGAMTYSQADELSNQVAHALSRSGIAAGDSVAVWCRNGRRFVLTVIALGKLGVDGVLLNTGFAAPQVVDVVAREGAKLLVADPELAAGLSGLELDVDLHTDLDELTGGQPTTAPAAPPRHGGLVIMTSGTTGPPKGARRSPKSVDLQTATAIFDAIPYRTGDVFVVPAPLFHAWGLSQLTAAGLMSGTIVVAPRFDPAGTLQLVAEHRATVLSAVPVMLQRILDLDPADDPDTSSLRIVATSGSAYPTGMATAWMDRFGDNLYNIYGSSEVALAAVAGPEDLRADPQTAGRPPAGTTVRIVTDDGTSVPHGETGKVVVGSGMVFDGYTGGTDRPRIGGLMEIGDIGHFDEAGRLAVDGRADDLVVSGGENISPHLTEEALTSHPDVAEAVAVGVPDDEMGQRLVAFVVVVSGSEPDVQRLRDHVRDNVARHQVPWRIEIVEDLPRNETGKVVRRTLVADWVATQTSPT